MTRGTMRKVSDSLHLCLSLLACALVIASGLALEAAAGLRWSTWYEDRLLREFVRLGHVHGGVLALLNLGLAAVEGRIDMPSGWRNAVRSAALFGFLAVALGFVAGGLWHGPTDPGPAIVLVPAGALLMVSALLVFAWFARNEGRGGA